LILLMTEMVEGIEEEWSKVKAIFQEAPEKTLGYRKSRERAEWISERTHKLMDERTGEEKAQIWQNNTTI